MDDIAGIYDVFDVLCDLTGIKPFSLEFIGLSFHHVFGGFMVIGLIGLLTMDYLLIEGIPFLFGGGQRARNGDGIWWLLVLVMIGIVSVQFSFYSAAKVYTGRLLKSAEGMILEVGESYEESNRNFKRKKILKDHSTEDGEQVYQSDEDLIAD
eukprot:CAMPEP_0184005628 /NCGR_PEP_ID=MMETSP0954-20121128/177_1 /TAXON_ID=627963 /ORGANISM="Aplanochytrium sp, Strain PBS07" /LENGTH=152 /DNA_ID=CAMNT_0026283955 /DNA_START=1031 /DNA_END=1489 /DNA_ORIENTATION=-